MTTDPELETEVETVEIPLETLADVAFNLAPEVLRNDEYRLHLPDGADSDDVPSIYDLRNEYTFYETVTDDKRGWGVVFGGPVEIGVGYRVSRGSYYHPPEYDVDVYEMGFTLAFYPGDNDGFGSATFEVDF